MSQNRKALAGLVVVGVVVLMALFPAGLARVDPLRHDRLNAFEEPAATSWFGTDQFGRDVYSRVVWGARPSLLVALASVSIAGVLGIPLGLIAGFQRGRVARMLTRIIDVFMAFPAILVAISVVGILGTGTTSVIVALGITFSAQYARVVRGEALVLRERDFVLAAKASGAVTLDIVLRHILANTVNAIVVVSTLLLSYAVLAEATLSFLGIGLSPETPTWGRMIDESRSYLETEPWMFAFPSLAFFLTVLGLNLLGDGVRDVFDPRLRVRRMHAAP